ncbi:glutamate racemase [Methylobacillus flagellatus KT]|uniref:Glutamate racemase n=2 Tax=Methylobacillus flagellatus TaxID=405 RepID=Q1H3P3_METFK|nr:glutamate racemase [Methylobacillus flagellatus KT]
MHSLESTSMTPAIGVFDSGVGGLSVLRHIQQQLPHEHLLYVADSLNAPYGPKPQAFIIERSRNIAQFLIESGAKAIVVACNTATAAAIRILRNELDIPVIGMEPAVKPAAAATRSGVVGVLATTGTLKSAQFAALLEHYGKHIKVVAQACVGLVECIERGELDTPSTRALVAGYVAPLMEEGADTIVLGCTHYPFIKPLIADIAGPDVVLIDTGAAVARQVGHRLEEAGLLTASRAPGSVKAWTNSAAGNAQQLIRLLHAGHIDVEVFNG